MPLQSTGLMSDDKRERSANLIVGGISKQDPLLQPKPGRYRGICSMPSRLKTTPTMM